MPSTLSESPARVVKGGSVSHVLRGKSHGAARGRSGVLSGGGSLGVHVRRARACSEALQAGEGAHLSALCHEQRAFSAVSAFPAHFNGFSCLVTCEASLRTCEASIYVTRAFQRYLDRPKTLRGSQITRYAPTPGDHDLSLSPCDGSLQGESLVVSHAP